MTLKMEAAIAELVSTAKPSNEPQFTLIEKVIKGETFLVMAQTAIQFEDEWSSLYYSANSGQSNLFLQPPFNPLQLKQFVVTNNILDQCVEAMEVNIDGTGIEWVPTDEKTTIDETERAAAESFFGEPYPNTSFVKIRRKLRRDMESIGYAFLEVLRNVAGEVVGLRNLETHSMRFVKLDEPILVKKTISRNGKDIEMSYLDRERRFAQLVGAQKRVYYKEFGATRDLNRLTGVWSEKDQKLDAKFQATELLLFGVHPDVNTSYFVPRWINQMPSVVGSRKAEEQNLEFFDSGGIPPAIIFVQGGTMTKSTNTQLQEYLSGKNRNKYRAVVVEAQSSSGSMEAAGTVQVKVERFGAERSQDAFYMTYDQAAEEHVRVAFRIPPLFLGKPADYNFATAVTAYMVAEEQVFQPERTAFDEMINMTIIKEMGWKTLKMKSLPITLTDVTTQISALAIVADKVTTASLVGEVEKMTGLKLEAMDQEVTPDGNTVHLPPGKKIPEPPKEDPAPPNPVVLKPGDKLVHPVPGKEQTNVLPFKRKTAKELIELVRDYASAKGVTAKKRDVSPERMVELEKAYGDLVEDDQVAFNAMLANYTVGSSDPDLVNMAAHAHTHV